MFSRREWPFRNGTRAIDENWTAFSRMAAAAAGRLPPHDSAPNDVLDVFGVDLYPSAMPDTPNPCPATPGRDRHGPFLCVQFDGGKRVHHADDAMARITAAGWYAT